MSSFSKTPLLLRQCLIAFFILTYNTSVAQITRLLDVQPRDDFYEGHAVVGSTMYFMDYLDNIWKTKGTPSTTTKFFSSNGSWFINSGLLELNGNLIFSADYYGPDSATSGLWKIIPENPTPIFLEGGRYPFKAGNHILSFNNNEIFRSDGTVSGTTLVDWGLRLNSLFHPHHILQFKSKTYFVDDYRDLWSTDGTPGSTVRVFDFPTTTSTSILYFLGMTNNAMFLIHFNSDESESATLWRSDGTAAGTYVIETFPGYASSHYYRPQIAVVVGSDLYFGVHQNDTNYSLWKTNGSPGNATKIFESNFYSFFSYDEIWNFFLFQDRLFFNGHRSSQGFELWGTSGTLSTTKILADLHPGTGSSYPSAPAVFPSHFILPTNPVDHNPAVIHATNGIHWETIPNTSIYFTLDKPVIFSNKAFYQAMETETYNHYLYVIEPTLPVSVETESEETASVYPNPVNADGKLTITTTLDGGKCRVYSSLGHLILETDNIASTFEISLKNQGPGLYYVQVSDGVKTQVMKVTVTR